MITSLIRSNLKNFQPYSSARSLYQKGLFLDANENSFGSVITTSLDSELNRYPDPYSLILRVALGKFLKIPNKNIFVGNGSDEAIDLLIRLFVEPDEEVMVMEPTYGMYKVAGALAGVKVKIVPLAKDFSIDFPKLFKQTSSKTKMVFFCSPNNPTGTLIPVKNIEIFCKKFKGLAIVDEAYIEFASKPSLVGKVKELENLCVLRTFSKAWGLAGIRVGYAVANEKVIEYLNKIKPPYNLNRLSSKLALKALGRYQKLNELRALVLTERRKLAQNLTKLGFKVFPSEANFLLCSYPEASQIAKKLATDFGIIVRDFGSRPSLRDCIRITVGTPRQNLQLIQSLTKIL
jgi:histidinol-phosphate aminotransferase